MIEKINKEFPWNEFMLQFWKKWLEVLEKTVIFVQ